MNLLESLKDPVEVLGVDVNAPDNIPEYKFVKCSFKKIDLLNQQEVHQMLANFNPDYLLHLASYSSVAYSWKNPVDAFVNNTNIFLNLVDKVRILGLGCRILSIGSSEEYGNISPGNIPVHEQIVTRPTSPYAIARVSQEMLSKVYADNYNIDIAMTRSFNHIGPGQKDIFVISSFAKKLVDIKTGKILSKEITVGNISLIRDFVDVRDVVKAYYSLFNKGKKGQLYNICSGKGISLNEILVKMMDMLELSLSINTDQSLIRPDDNKVIIGSNKKIFEETAWQPSISLEQSLRDIIDYWMKKA
jgi:GDP-4-dehydro-6-deoxy-D-mannose reductase